MQAARWFRLSCALSLSASAASCGSSVDLPSRHTPVVVSGRVTDAATKKPLAGAVIAVEIGGHYVTNPDPSKANPSYQRGTVTDEQGSYSLTLPGPSLGFHSFVKGFKYGTDGVEGSGTATLDLSMEPAKEPPPTLTGATLTPTTVAPGGALTISVTAAKAPGSKDPLSEEVLVVEPINTMSAALDPPSAGVQGTGYPDGVWRRALVAPMARGHYVYYLTVTTEGCVVGDVVQLPIDVM